MGPPQGITVGYLFQLRQSVITSFSQWQEWPELFQTSKMEIFATIVNNFKTLSVVANLSIAEVCESRGYVSDGTRKMILVCQWH